TTGLERHRSPRFGEERAGLVVGSLHRIADANRYLPDPLARRLGPERQVPRLGELEPPLFARAGALHLDERYPFLIDEAAEGAPHVAARRAAHGVEQLVGRSEPVLVRRHVGTDPFAECVGAEVAFEHAEERAALPVGEPVEGILDVPRALDVLADAAGG